MTSLPDALPGRLQAIARADRNGVRLMAAGMLLLQLVWILALPPFRGMDEFDHVYRAASVVRGQWAPEPEAATRGTGAWLVVPEDIVAAARPECQRLDYTTENDCIGTPVGESVRIASGAGRYHPAFYAVVGLPSLLLEGPAALYGMRAVAAGLCLGMFVLALWVTGAWARTRWPFVALALVSTPVLLYSTAVVAPNGLEMLAGMTLWSALMGLVTRADPGQDRRLLLVVLVAASVLVTLRSLGPVWCLLIAVSVVVALPLTKPRFRQVLVESRGWVVATAVVALTAASTWWVAHMGSHVIATKERDPLQVTEKLSLMAGELILWPLQSIAAFPYRNQPTHVSVYALFLTLGLIALGLCVYHASTRLRLGILAAVVVAYAVPAAVTFATINDSGLAWQGRYGLPYSVGVFLLGSLALDRVSRAPGPAAIWVGASLYAVGQAIGPTLVARDERLLSPGVDNGAWVLVHPLLLGGLALLGGGLLWLGGAAVPGASREEVDRDRSDSDRRRVSSPG